MFLLLSCWILAGIMAGDPLPHYRLKSSSLCLHVRKPPPYESGKWTFGGKVIASGEKIINPNYTEKAYYNPKNLSLCIKDLTDRDSGSYQVTFFDANFNDVSEKHTVVVQDTVPTPVIAVSGPSSNLSAGPCKITVNCSIQDNWVWAECDNEGCRPSHKSFSEVNISISTESSAVVCTGNNYVSTNNVSESLAMCFSKSNPDDREPIQPPFMVIGIVAVSVSVFLCACIFVLARRLCSRAANHPQTSSNAQVHYSQTQLTEAQPQPEPRLSTSSSQAEASYENVDPSQPSQTGSSREEMGSMPNQEVDTVYSLLQATNVPHSAVKSGSSEDTKGHETIREASASQSVTRDEAEHHREINTVYSVLHKPKKVKTQHHQQVKEDSQKRCT